jgi:L1 cell adhesion molecule like protein
MTIAIGIDLGTTFSSVGYWAHGHPEIIADGDSASVPSIASYCAGEWIAGLGAQEMALQYPKHTIYDTKRMLACRYDMSTIQQFKQKWSFDIVQGSSGEILIAVDEDGRKKRYHPYEISGKILTHLKEMAQDRLNSPPQKAVITVPAYFKDAQREETKKAAKCAGLEVLRLVNEPTAAAVAYAFQRRPEGQCKVLVVDFGGGTLDVSLMQVDGMKFQVLAVDGDNHLGGRDFDALLIDYCLIQCKKAKPQLTQQSENDPRFRQTIVEKCQSVKTQLSRIRVAKVVFQFSDLSTLEIQVKREDFERMCEPFFKRMLEPVKGVLRNAGLNKSAVTDVLMVGESSKIPKVRSLMREFFGKEPFSGVDPLTAVAIGATIIATKLSNSEIQDIRQLECHECVGLAVGVACQGDIMDVIIPQGLPLPQEGIRRYSVSTHGQTGMSLKILEGPWLIASKNRELGTLNVLDIPPGRVGEQSVELILKLEDDGVLTAKAKVVGGSGSGAPLRVEKTGHLMTGTQVRILMAQMEAEEKKDREQVEQARRSGAVNNLVENVRLFMESETKTEPTFRNVVSPPAQERLNARLTRWTQAKLRRVLTSQEFHQAQNDAMEAFRPYFKGIIPSWLDTSGI